MKKGNTAPGHEQKPPGIQLKGTLSGLLTLPTLMVCTFSGWVEAFPTPTEKANEVAHCLLREIIPRLGFPTSIGSDNGPAFVADLIQQVCKALNIKWKLHTASRPQSSRMVERTNRTLKESLSKWITKTDCSWMDLLLAALLKLRVTLHSHGYSPYEIIYGRSPPIVSQVSTNLPQIRGGEISHRWNSCLR